ncbi:hypothetical protein K9N08_00795 [Candidatus Gracilibacteria bacterium]|nr:hypothetical protein [Candidatus Gracilibacteria bacterium]MCF7856081.1 hypothetical protein [Candidatus Gracilibacteria bacterium]MCF7896500.1 hypothetical protein [Candidatus Gracilibacteria bacterium]
MHKFLPVFIVIILFAGCHHEVPILENKIGTDISAEEAEFNASGRAKAVEDETDLWQFFEDSKTGFSLRYPLEIDFGQDLRIESEFVASLGERPLGFTTENATKIRDALAAGKFGKNNLDWPLESSKQVKNLGELSGQDFLVLGRFEICDVAFERKLVFYLNDRQVVLTVVGDRDKILAENPEFFTTNPENCFEAKIWNFDKQKDFYKNLAKGKGSPVAQKWFDTFDAIVATIEFQTPESKTEARGNLESLQGFWTSIEDTKSTVEFSGERKTDFYDGEKVSEEYFKVDGDSLVVNAGVDTIKYSIVAVSPEYLTLLHLPRGNLLKFKR